MFGNVDEYFLSQFASAEGRKGGVCCTLRCAVKRILRKYRYSPDMPEKATETVLEQAALLSEAWAA